MIIKNHTAKLTLEYVEISSTKEISPVIFNLAPSKFLGHRQKTFTFFTKISQESLGQLLRIFSSLKPHELGLHGPTLLLEILSLKSL